MTTPIEYYPGFERDLRRGYTQETLDDATAMRRTQPIVYPPPPLWKVVRLRLELAWSKAVTFTETIWRRLCNRLDAHPVVVLLLLACSGYVGVMLALMVRHMAFGIW